MRRRLQDRSVWHRWYAWHPVQVSERGVEFLVWLEWVERRGGWTGTGWTVWYRMPKREGNA